MGVKERRIRQKEEVRSLILATAWQLVKKEGWESLSIRKIADAIEYSIPVIYDHFENKEAILLEFAAEGFRLLTKKLKKARENYTKPTQQLKAMAEAYWNFAFRNREYYQLMYGVGMACCESQKCIEGKGSFRDIIHETIGEVIAKGKNPDANNCLKTHAFWSILHGLISIKIMGNSNIPDNLDKMVLDDAIDGFIKNLG